MIRSTKSLVVLFAVTCLIATVPVLATSPEEAGEAATPVPALAQSHCEAPLGQGEALEDLEALLEPAASPRFLTCGTCSDSVCRGLSVGSICGIGGSGQYKLCGDTGFCSGTTTFDCLCSTRPPF